MLEQSMQVPVHYAEYRNSDGLPGSAASTFLASAFSGRAWLT